MKLNEIRIWVETRLRYRLPGAIHRYRTALAYALGRHTKRQALEMIWDCQEVIGSWPIVTIDAERVLELAREKWEDHDALEGFARDAASRVASKWTDDGEYRGAAEDWAITLVGQYASDRGIELVEIDEYAIEETA